MTLHSSPGRPSVRRPCGAWRRGLPALLVSLLCAGAAPAPPAAATTLEDGLILKRDLRPGDRHLYPVALEEGQLLRVVVDQNGVDVVVRLLDSGGTQVLAVDSPNGCDGDEDFAAVAQRSGLHQIEISVSGGEGGYSMKIEDPRLPTDRDRLRVEAVRATQEALAAEGKEGPEQRLARYQKALALWEELGEPRRQAEILYRIGGALGTLGQPERAVEIYSKAARLWEELGDRGMGDPRFHVEALNETGVLLYQLFQWKEAQARFEEALALAIELKNLRQQTAVLHNLGRLTVGLGDPRAGVELLQQSIDLARQIGWKQLEAAELNTLGSAFMSLSDRQQALRSYDEALEICREIRDRATESSVLNNLGEAYESLGERERALGYYNDALRLHRELGNRAKEAITLNNLGVVYQRLGETEKTLDLLGQALTLARTIGDKGLQASFLTNQGFVRLLRGEASQAREAALAALELVGGRGGAIESDARQALGSALRLLGDYEGARSELATALSLSQERGDQNREAEVILALARLEKDRRDLARALSWIEQSVAIIESLRTRVVSQDLRASFLASKQAHYELHIDILMSLDATQPGKDYAARALRVSEQARARSLLEILQEGGADIQQGAAPALLERERRLRGEVSTRELQRLALRGDKAATPERLAEAEKRLKETLDEYREVQEELRESSSRYAALTQPRPLEVDEIRTQVLDGAALLLEYALGTERSYLWAVTPGSVESFTLPARDRIEELARRYYGLLTSRNQPLPPTENEAQHRERLGRLDAEAERTAAELSRILLQPVQHLLKGQSLLVVADGALQYIPFAALPIPATGALLIEKQEVVSLPSASALAVLRREARERPAPSRTLAVLADPVFQKKDPRLAQLRPKSTNEVASSSKNRGSAPGHAPEREGEADLQSFLRLSHSGKEAEAITSLLPPDQTFKALGFEASRATATSGRLADYRNVHFATHGVVKSDHPELSSLVLSLFDEQGKPLDGFLRLNDIYNLELRADLVVLSACRTALGKEIRGEGLVGLTRGFMYAGAARVLATLWSVDDRATADFMKHFYRAMLNQRLSPAAALRQAQLAMRDQSNHASPYYWAGFSLQGEWK